MPRKVGLVGCGTIGRELAMAISAGKIEGAQLVSIFDVVSSQSEKLRLEIKQDRPSAFQDWEKFLASDTDLVIEAASQQAVKDFASDILESGKDIMIMSVGALADEQFLSKLLRGAEQSDTRIYIPTGAIAGIDAVKSVHGLLDSVTLTTTKSPKSLAGAPFFQTSKIELDKIKTKTVIYEGNASDAVKAFPANVNVAAVLSLAGLGIKKTKVKIVADPDTKVNQHEITASGSFGEFQITVRNVPSPSNPKTSYMAILSAMECLRSICNPRLKIGS